LLRGVSIMPQVPTAHVERVFTMRHIVQPGSPSAERIQWVEARGRAFSFMLDAGLPLLDGVRRGFAAAGFASGVLTIAGGALGPFAYVMPALSKTPEHAAYYSDTFRPLGTTRLKAATMTFGKRDGVPFFHCHGLWTEADGRLGGGHMLPEETVVAEACRVEAFGLSGAVFVAEHDHETNFKLFGPLPAPPASAATTGRAFALRLRPNQDFASAIEDFCRARGISHARLRGGVGSIIGARFDDGRSVEPLATEMAVVSGHVTPHPRHGLTAELDVFLVDHLGGTAEGRLKRGDNPVLMTMELVLEG
jgi:predicted DNA-binding protein with PD1-like motif